MDNTGKAGVDAEGARGENAAKGAGSVGDSARELLRALLRAYLRQLHTRPLVTKAAGR